MIDFDANGKNKYYSLYKTLREDIISGKMRGGERLPSKRALARMLGVSVTTVMLAYGQLAAEGYVCPRERSGHFVEKLNGVPNLNKKSSPLYGVGKIPSVKSGEETRRYSCDLVKGVLPAQLFPFSTWARLMRRVLNDCGEHLLERVPKDGDAQLKYAISAYLFRSRGMEVDPRFIVVGAGAEYLYGVIVQLLGRDKPYAVENPCYTKIPSVYALNGYGFAFARQACGVRGSRFPVSSVSYGRGHACFRPRRTDRLGKFRRRVHHRRRLRQRVQAGR